MGLGTIKPGDVFDQWTVLERVPGSQWVCVCTCGRRGIVKTGNLTQRLSKRCRECGNRTPNRLRYTLNLSRAVFEKLSNAARSAIRRCSDSEYPQWKDYGGRGIAVHPEWIEDYGKFVAYLAMLPGHDDPSLVIDRTDNDGNYEPGNLRFVTREVSVVNRRARRK